MNVNLRQRWKNRMRPMEYARITVTQEHIDAGVPCSWEAGPIALALAEAFPEAREITACCTFAEFELLLCGKVFMPFLDADVIDVMDRFDDGEPIQPFSFTGHVMHVGSPGPFWPMAPGGCYSPERGTP